MARSTGVAFTYLMIWQYKLRSTRLSLRFVQLPASDVFLKVHVCMRAWLIQSMQQSAAALATALAVGISPVAHTQTMFLNLTARALRDKYFHHQSFLSVRLMLSCPPAAPTLLLRQGQGPDVVRASVQSNHT